MLSATYGAEKSGAAAPMSWASEGRRHHGQCGKQQQDRCARAPQGVHAAAAGDDDEAARANSADGIPTPTMWMNSPFSSTGSDGNARTAWIADDGTTTSVMMKYTAMP